MRDAPRSAKARAACRFACAATTCARACRGALWVDPDPDRPPKKQRVIVNARENAETGMTEEQQVARRLQKNNGRIHLSLLGMCRKCRRECLQGQQGQQGPLA
jgi:hypothetical protein